MRKITIYSIKKVETTLILLSPLQKRIQALSVGQVVGMKAKPRSLTWHVIFLNSLSTYIEKQNSCQFASLKMLGKFPDNKVA